MNLKKSLNIGSHLESKTFHLVNPNAAIEVLLVHGINRVILPGHNADISTQTKDHYAVWIEELHKVGMTALLYTGPFGTEWTSRLTEEATHWVQRGLDEKPLTYDSGGYLAMFCPVSPYLRRRRIPIVIDLLVHTQADGIFWDIPWVMGEHGTDGCHCDYCHFISKTDFLTKQEQMVYLGMLEGNSMLRKSVPGIQIAANAAAPSIWDSSYRGGSHRAMGNIVDELVTEWTPGKKDEKMAPDFYKSITKSITMCQAVNANVSHAFSPANMRKEHAATMKEKISERGAGFWTNDLELPLWLD